VSGDLLDTFCERRCPPLCFPFCAYLNLSWHCLGSRGLREFIFLLAGLLRVRDVVSFFKISILLWYFQDFLALYGFRYISRCGGGDGDVISTVCGDRGVASGCGRGCSAGLVDGMTVTRLWLQRKPSMDKSKRYCKASYPLRGVSEGKCPTWSGPSPRWHLDWGHGAQLFLGENERAIGMTMGVL